MVIAALVGVLLLPFHRDILHPSVVAESFNLIGFLALFLIVIPIHEAAHAVACRLAGAEVGVAGIIMHGGLIPGPYVETSKAYRLKEKSKRFWIPAAGPLVDWCAAGIVAWIILLSPGLGETAVEALSYLFILCLLFVYFDTNPFTASDGSHMLEALLDDELARKSALSRQQATLSAHSGIKLYRRACVAHLLLAIAILVYWWL